MKVRKVILVEDDPDDRELFAAFLSGRSDIEIVTSVTNGRELIEFLSDVDDKQLPDLIVIDQNMPLMTGKQTLKYLKSSDRYRNIPAVIYSTHADNNLVLECSALGAKMVSSKPLNEEGYNRMMDNFLKL